MRPISTTARRTCGRTSPPGPRVCTALATTLRTERTARVTAFAASFGAGDGLGQFDYFLPLLLDAGAEALFVIHSGGFVLTARACCFCLRRGLGRGMASRFTGQLVCCSCVLIRLENLLRTDGPTTHARGPRPGPDPASDAAHVLIHVGHCEAGRTHTPLQVTREPRDLGGPYSRPAPLQSALISHPTRRGRSRRRSPWLVLHRSCGTQPQCLEVVWCTGVNVNAT